MIPKKLQNLDWVLDEAPIQILKLYMEELKPLSCIRPGDCPGDEASWKKDIHSLHNDVLVEIFSYLSAKMQNRCSLVCRRWYLLLQKEGWENTCTWLFQKCLSPCELSSCERTCFLQKDLRMHLRCIHERVEISLEDGKKKSYMIMNDFSKASYDEMEIVQVFQAASTVKVMLRFGSLLARWILNVDIAQKRLNYYSCFLLRACPDFKIIGNSSQGEDYFTDGIRVYEYAKGIWKNWGQMIGEPCREGAYLFRRLLKLRQISIYFFRFADNSNRKVLTQRFPESFTNSLTGVLPLFFSFSEDRWIYAYQIHHGSTHHLELLHTRLPQGTQRLFLIEKQRSTLFFVFYKEAWESCVFISTTDGTAYLFHLEKETTSLIPIHFREKPREVEIFPLQEIIHIVLDKERCVYTFDGERVCKDERFKDQKFGLENRRFLSYQEDSSDELGNPTTVVYQLGQAFKRRREQGPENTIPLPRKARK